MASQASIKQKATEHAARGEYDLAIEEYNKILSENDNDAAVHNLVGDTYLKMGNKEQAIDEFERAVEIYAEDAFYTNAVAVCKKILRADGERASCYEDLAELYGKQGLLGEAVANYREFADRMKAKGDLEKVFVTYQAIKELMPKKVDTRLALVDMYLARNRSEDAVAELREVAKLFREQDKVEQAEEVEQRIFGLGGSLEGEAPAEEQVAVPEAEERPVEEGGPDFYSQFQAVPPDTVEGEPRGAGVSPAEESTAVAAEEPEVFETVETISSGEITFEQTTSDLETEHAEAPVEAVEEEPLEIEKEPAEAAAEQSAESELGVRQGEGQYEPMFKSSPTDWASYIELGDLCLSVGSTDEAMEYYYKAGDAFFEEKSFDRAAEIYEKIAEIKPLEIRPRQRLAQIAQKKGDATLMISAYTSLAECLDKRGAAKEADTVYRKLLAVDPNNQTAKSRVSSAAPEVSLSSLADEAVFAEPVSEPSTPTTSRAERGVQIAPEPELEPAGTISFDDVIAEVTGESGSAGPGASQEAGPKSGLLSMSEVLREFKEGVEENIPAADFSSHYDLGITYKEMGLLDEAVMEFEKASRGPEMAAKAFEMLGRIYLEKKDFSKAVSFLNQGLEAKVDMPEEHMGLYYSLGLAHEALGEKDRALEAYKKVRGFDPNFGDIGARIEAVGVSGAAVEEGATPGKEEKPSEERPPKKKGKISYV